MRFIVMMIVENIMKVFCSRGRLGLEMVLKVSLLSLG